MKFSQATPKGTSPVFILISLIFLFLSFPGLSAQDSVPLPRFVESRDHAVLLSSRIGDNSFPTLILSWEPDDLALMYSVRRKAVGDSVWSQPLAVLDGRHNTFTDNFIKHGIPYEYEVESYNYGSFVDHIYDSQGNFIKDSIYQEYFLGYGYIVTGNYAGPFDNYGKLLLLVDSVTNFKLDNEINQYMETLYREGWGVARRVVPRAEEFNPSAVKEVKNLIRSEYEKDPENLKTVFLFGRVPVIYSGDFAPDGHPNHVGAWAADMYYAVLDESLWVDSSANDITSERRENHNIPGDGKFDISDLGRPAVDLQLGRVDLYDMPIFPDNEITLLKNYLAKDIAYRSGEIQTENRGIVSEHFWARDYIEGFASSGWRNFASFFGRPAQREDWVPLLQEQPYLWAYGCGAGYYNYAHRVINDTDLVQKPLNAIFTMLFGSYFGDWDVKNDVLRAMLASRPSVLTCAWAGRPAWYFHHMNLGFPIGYSTRLTQNNYMIYKPNKFFFETEGNFIPLELGTQNVHIALMGDPTLRMHMNEVDTVISLSVVTDGAGAQEIRWNYTYSENSYVNLYRRTSKEEPFIKINRNNSSYGYYVDTLKYSGDVEYMVKVVKALTNNSGTNYYTGRGKIASITLTSAEENYTAPFSVEVSPNPASSEVNIRINNSAQDLKSFVTDLFGNEILSLYSGTASPGVQSISWNLAAGDGIKVPPGIYFLHVTSGYSSRVTKIVVL